jgi:hypothetical protein
MMTHTRGPWITEADSETNEISIFARNAEPYHFLPAVAIGPNREANARLIAAAPEMYETLIRAKGYILALGPENSVTKQIDKVITKAEGRQ